jgi:hypothetical protein
MGVGSFDQLVTQSRTATGRINCGSTCILGPGLHSTRAKYHSYRDGAVYVMRANLNTFDTARPLGPPAVHARLPMLAAASASLINRMSRAEV